MHETKAGSNLVPVTPSPQRLLSLDAYRGFVMLMMISAGLGYGFASSEQRESILRDETWGVWADQMTHREWEGCTAWDLIQPSFMFIVGVAMPIAFAVRQERGQSWKRQFGHAVKRALLLIALGIFLDWYNGSAPYHIRLIRVLQQIAIGYLIAFFVLHLGPKVQLTAALGLLAVHTGCYLAWGAVHDLDPWRKWHNFGTDLDYYYLNLGFNRGGYVTFNAVSSAATILFGCAAGELLRRSLSAGNKVLILMLAGGVGLGLGWVLMPWVPMVKRIWTASFTFWAAGWTCFLLAGFYLIIDGIRLRKWAFPLIVAGMNSIALYVMAGTLKEPVKKAWKPIADHILSIYPEVPSDKLTDYPVAMSLLFVLTLWGICFWMYRKRIFFKV